MSNGNNLDYNFSNWEVYDATQNISSSTNTSGNTNSYDSYDSPNNSDYVVPDNKLSKELHPLIGLLAGFLLTACSVLFIFLLLDYAKTQTSFNNNCIKVPCTILQCERNGTSGKYNHDRYYIEFELNYNGINYNGVIRKSPRSFDVGSTHTLYFTEDFSEYTLTPQDNFSISLGSKLGVIIVGFITLLGLNIIWGSLKRLFKR